MKADRCGDYLQHMLEATHTAMAYVDRLDKSAFMADRRTQQAVLHNIMIIGEAAGQLALAAPELVAACPEVPWASLRGMRNRVAHGYFEIDLDVVWATVQTAMPALLPALVAAQRRLTSGLNDPPA